MAAPSVKATAPRASSILSQEVTADTQGGKPVPAGAPLTTSSGAWVTLRRVFFTAADVGQAEKLYDILNRMQEATLQILGVVSTNQILPGNILRGVKFTTDAQTQQLAHGLGRKWQGYFIVRASLITILTDGVYSAGIGADTVIPLKSLYASTVDIYVF